ncbi:hypothetical protein L6452_19403 [Arctium lappa]|uniref:Uncharacterized protein n=1 Tax=Arctium lappa TaxID=4217 RepID=A0ACB9B7S2_ARCLA|nr:hypothetical protein L6452_19403 [Arctium lappa]
MEAKPVEAKIYVPPLILESKISELESTLVDERILVDLEKIVFSTVLLNTDFKYEVTNDKSKSKRVCENISTDSDASSCKAFMGNIFSKQKPSDFDQMPYQKQFSKEFNDFMFPKSSKASQSGDDDLFEYDVDFLNSDGCFDECVEKFDFNAKLHDHFDFVVKSEALPSVFEKGESSTKVDETILVSTYYAKGKKQKEKALTETDQHW